MHRLNSLDQRRPVDDGILAEPDRPHRLRQFGIADGAHLLALVVGIHRAVGVPPQDELIAALDVIVNSVHEPLYVGPDILITLRRGVRSQAGRKGFLDLARTQVAQENHRDLLDTRRVDNGAVNRTVVLLDDAFEVMCHGVNPHEILLAYGLARLPECSLFVGVIYTQALTEERGTGRFLDRFIRAREIRRQQHAGRDHPGDDYLCGVHALAFVAPMKSTESAGREVRAHVSGLQTECSHARLGSARLASAIDGTFFARACPCQPGRTAPITIMRRYDESMTTCG